MNCLQWELVNGPDLLDLLNAAPDKKLSEPMVAYYFQQLINAVIFMHNNGFCHRDLKAENCVVDSSTQRVKVQTPFCCYTHVTVLSTLLAVWGQCPRFHGVRVDNASQHTVCAELF